MRPSASVAVLVPWLALGPWSCPTSAARFQTSTIREVHLTHSFGGGPDRPDVELQVTKRPGVVRTLADGRRFDVADYSDVGRLLARRPLLVGPLPTGPTLLPAGEYRLDLAVAGREGLPVLVLRSATGARLRLMLPAAPRPARRPTALGVESLAGPGEESLPLALHLPTVSGLLVVAPEGGEPVSPARRRSRSQVLWDEMDRRALESGQARRPRRQGAPARP